MTQSDKGLTIVWVLLVSATLLSFVVFELGTQDRYVAATIVIGMASAKILLILWHFMELKEGALPWKLAFAVWTMVCATIIVGLYWAT